MDTYPIHFREEVLKKFFDHISSGESFYVIGAPSVGKTRLMDFLMGDDPDNWRNTSEEPDRERVKRHYLDGEDTSKIWLARVDMNRMRHEHDWGFLFYELLLHTVLLACNRVEASEQNDAIKANLAALDSDVIESKDALKAHRFFEMAINMLCQSYGIKLCFLFDEFDITYQTMPRELFAHLRAIRDANKYRVSYALFLRNLPEKLRDPMENESFYELISRNMLGLAPYSMQDTFHIIEQLQKRRGYKLAPEKREWLCVNSGGHPGLVQALFTLLKEHPHAAAHMQDLEWFAQQDSVIEEFRKIWAGLLEEEQVALKKISQGNQSSVSQTIGKMMLAKGLIKPSSGHMGYFTPLFGYWLK